MLAPLRVPEPWASRFPPWALTLPANVDAVADGEPGNRRQGVAAQLADGVSMSEWRAAWAAHLGLTALADAVLGEILAALEARGTADQTLTIFCSDHGENLGQHGMYQKMEMYEPAWRVPLLVRWPGGRPGRCEMPVSHLDLLPTILDWADLPTPAGLPGRSLRSVVRDGEPLLERPVFGLYAGNAGRGDQRRAVVTQRWKYIWDPATTPELYDLVADPLEMHNLAADAQHAATLAELHAQLRAWASSQGDWLTP